MYLRAEISLFLRPIHNSLCSGFVVGFYLSFFLKCRVFLKLHKTFLYQIETQEKIVKYENMKKENFMIFITL